MSVLLGIIKRLSGEGIAVVFVSHRMDEIPRVADSITILRDGRHVATGPITEFSTGRVVELMTGGATLVEVNDKRQQRSPGDLRLKVSDLQAGLLDGIGLELKSGEIVGLAGLLGSGRSELLRTIFGLETVQSGRIELDGRSILGLSPRKLIARGIGFAPEERKKDGLVLGMSIAENLTFGCPSKVTNYGMLNLSNLRQVANDARDRLSIKANNLGASVSSLSGGNQQKVVLGKWLSADSRVLLLDEPTRGVDVEAKRQIYALLSELADEGFSILVASSEMEELFEMCDRLLVLRQGKLVAQAGITETSLPEIMSSAMEGVIL